ncbi:hypothetical protein [Atopobium fossor]|uniref:hypothetical protein n=1 Tax=Atopobium fossor TaxID=39487 RepID=UPI00040A72A2|nr:hypothetical protein [Atopobium fossor]
MSRCSERPVPVSTYKKTGTASLIALIIFGIIVALYIANKPAKQLDTVAPVTQTDTNSPSN